MKYPFFKYTTGWYSEQPPEQPAHTSRLSLHGKMDVKFSLMFIVAENSRSVNVSNTKIKYKETNDNADDDADTIDNNK